jgi:hypothetical protein
MKHIICSMNGPVQPDSIGEIPVVLKEMLKGGLALLWRGFAYARDLAADRCAFAVSYDVLSRAGLADIDLHWLIARGYVEPARITVPAREPATFPGKDLSLKVKDACFILTEMGAALAQEVLLGTLPPAASLVCPENGHQAMAGSGLAPAVRKLVAPKPTWDRERKELRCGEWVIKQFRWAAVNQETILMAFEEEAWPSRIDDPLPQTLNQDPKCRLHDTIKHLNRNHQKRLIRFHGDGTGEGILWTFSASEDTDP